MQDWSRRRSRCRRRPPRWRGPRRPPPSLRLRRHPRHLHLHRHLRLLSPPPPPPAPAPPPQAAVASRGTTAPAGADDEVRRLLDRYAAAWRNHDVGELRRIGQITSDSQAADLERYFAKVEDLDVEVHVLDIQNDGDRSTVRFTRRDRFRDPTGRMVSQESPPIEKHVVRAPDGLRFEPR